MNYLLINYPVYNRSKKTNSLKQMSTSHHEQLLETCFEQAVEQFCTHNKLTPEMFAELESIKGFNAGLQIMLEKSAQKIFEDMCQ